MWYLYMHSIERQKSSDFNEIWHTDTDLELGESQGPNMKIFKIQGGRRLFTIVLGHNSAADCPISVKFCTEKQNRMTVAVT